MYGETQKWAKCTQRTLWERQHVWSMLADKITSLLMAYRSAEWIYRLALSLAITQSATQKQINADVHQCVNTRIKTEQLSKTLFKGAASHPASKTIFISLKYPLVQAYLLLGWIYSSKCNPIPSALLLLAVCLRWQWTRDLCSGAQFRTGIEGGVESLDSPETTDCGQVPIYYTALTNKKDKLVMHAHNHC